LKITFDRAKIQGPVKVRMMLKRSCLLFLLAAKVASAFAPTSTWIKPVQLQANSGGANEPAENADRRSFLSSLIASGAVVISASSAVADDSDEEESFSSIAARASKLSGAVGENAALTVIPKSDDPRTAYDFELPVEGTPIAFKDLVHQEYSEEGIAKVKALLVINMKEDDPIARKDIPEFISLATK
jgi:hypothetical protein